MGGHACNEARELTHLELASRQRAQRLNAKSANTRPSGQSVAPLLSLTQATPLRKTKRDTRVTRYVQLHPIEDPQFKHL